MIDFVTAIHKVVGLFTYNTYFNVSVNESHKQNLYSDIF